MAIDPHSIDELRKGNREQIAEGRRQALRFARKTTPALCEFDVWASKTGEKRAALPRQRQGNARQRR